MEPVQEGLRRAHRVWEGGETSPLLSVGFRIPALDLDSAEVAALEVARELLVSDIGTVRRRLVDDEGMAWSLWAGGPERLDPGLLELHVQLREEAEVHAVEAVIAEEIAALSASENLDERVALVRDRLRRQAVLELGSPASWAFAVGWSTQAGGSPEAFERSLETLGQVDADAVRAAVKTWLVPAGLTVVSLSMEELPPPELDPWEPITPVTPEGEVTP